MMEGGNFERYIDIDICVCVCLIQRTEQHDYSRYVCDETARCLFPSCSVLALGVCVFLRWSWWTAVLIRGPVYYIKTRQQTTTSRVSTARPVRRGTILPWTFDSAPSASTILFLPRHHGGQERVRIIIVVFVIVLLVCNRHRTRRRRHRVGCFSIGP